MTQSVTSKPHRTMAYNQLSSCPDMETEFISIYERARKFTMTSLERMYDLYKAIEYIERAKIPGDIVECGVWQGGSAMICALALEMFGNKERKIYLYDTFAGMPDPGERDVDYNGDHADLRLNDKLPSFDCFANACLKEVRANVESTGYTADQFVFVEGCVEDTIPEVIPDQIALLRLDTDWYKSTQHEMLHLFPLLQSKGVLIVDDYGHWQGAREAVDEYLEEHGIPLLLSRCDYTGRMAVVP